MKTQNDLFPNSDASQSKSAKKALRASSSKPSLVDVTQVQQDGLYISIYKQKVRGTIVIFILVV